MSQELILGSLVTLLEQHTTHQKMFIFNCLKWLNEAIKLSRGFLNLCVCWKERKPNWGFMSFHTCLLFFFNKQTGGEPKAKPRTVWLRRVEEKEEGEETFSVCSPRLSLGFPLLPPVAAIALPPCPPTQPSCLPEKPEGRVGRRFGSVGPEALIHADRQSRESSVRKTSALHWKVPIPSRSSSQLFRLGEMSFTQMAWRVENRAKVKERGNFSSFNFPHCGINNGLLKKSSS